MEVLPAEEGIDHSLIPGDMGQQAQLDLAVIGVHQDAPLRCDEHPAHLRTQLLPHRDILEIRFGGREAAGGRYRHLEVGVNPAVG